MPTAFIRPVLTPAAEAMRRAEAGRATRVPADQVGPPAGLEPGGSCPLVSLTTDFGERDPSAAICRGVVLSIAPHARVLDISHEVAKFSIADGALLLWSALPYIPIGVHVGVIDPGVGTERLPIVLRVARGDLLVGPDNGLLLPAAERLGGVTAAHVLESPEFRLPAVSATFHGRDIFAPAGAHLALGVAPERFGRRLDPGDLVGLDLPRPQAVRGVLRTGVVYVDTFGNVKLAGERDYIEAALGPLATSDALALALTPREPILGAGRPGRADLASEPVPWAVTFGEVGRGGVLLYEDSHGRLCLAVNQASAGARFGLRPGDLVSIRRAGGTG